jgi:hypothetical protein
LGGGSVLAAKNSNGSPRIKADKLLEQHTRHDTRIWKSPAAEERDAQGGDAATQGLSAALAGETDVFTVSTSEVCHRT